MFSPEVYLTRRGINPRCAKAVTMLFGDSLTLQRLEDAYDPETGEFNLGDVLITPKGFLGRQRIGNGSGIGYSYLGKFPDKFVSGIMDEEGNISFGLFLVHDKKEMFESPTSLAEMYQFTIPNGHPEEAMCRYYHNDSISEFIHLEDRKDCITSTEEAIKLLTRMVPTNKEFEDLGILPDRERQFVGYRRKDGQAPTEYDLLYTLCTYINNPCAITTEFYDITKELKKDKIR